jgi:hypothetical protein
MRIFQKLNLFPFCLIWGLGRSRRYGPSGGLWENLQSLTFYINFFQRPTAKELARHPFIKKAKRKLNGWSGYTLSKTDRIFEEINNGEPYPATYDRRHDISLVANYEINKKWNIGGVFVYGTGNAFTPLRSLYFIENNLNVSYGARNSARIQPYHRMDLSASWTPKPDSEKRFKSSWTFSVYNTYNRQNPFFISYDISADTNTGVAQAQALKVSIFPVIPSVTWNFKWKQARENEK